MIRRPVLLTAVLAATAACAPAGPAGAGVFPGETVDAGVEIQRLGDLDLGRDGTGAVAYTKIDGGVPHVFVSRFVAGAFEPPERLDGGIEAAGTDPVVAAGNNGRVAVMWSSGGVLYGSVRAAGDQPWAGPTAISPGTKPHADMSINGTAYGAFVNGGDVMVVRLDRRTNAWALIGAPADINPAAAAGVGDNRPRVSVAADGVGLVTWGEEGGDGISHVWARKAFGTNLSARPQDLTVGELDGRRGLSADTPEIEMEDDSSFAWAAFRQEFDDGGTLRSRIVARRQRGTEFDPPAFVDGLGFPAPEGAELPRVALSGRGEGFVVSSGQASRQPIFAPIQNDQLTPGGRLGGPAAVAPEARPVMAENNDGHVFWVQGPGDVRFRPFDDFKPGPDVTVSRGDQGAIDPSLGFDAATDRANSALAVWVQGTGPERAIRAGLNDRPPLAFRGSTGQSWRRSAELRWQDAFDLWGPLTYTVLVDDQPVGRTQERGLTPTVPPADGEHTWRVIATDRRGQSTSSATRRLRLDRTEPSLRVTVGRRRVSWRASDPARPTASGIKYVRVKFGNAKALTRSATRGSVPRRRGGSIRVSATDRAGNATVRRRR